MALTVSDVLLSTTTPSGGGDFDSFSFVLLFILNKPNLTGGQEAGISLSFASYTMKVGGLKSSPRVLT